jgi:hypothetical protein
MPPPCLAVRAKNGNLALVFARCIGNSLDNYMDMLIGDLTSYIQATIGKLVNKLAN